MSDFYKTLHKQLRHLIDDLTIATDDDGHTLYVPKDTLMFSNFIAALIELMPALAAKAQPAQAGQVLTDDEVALIVAECAASAHRQDDFSFARAIEQAVLAKRVPPTDELHTFINAAAGDGFVLDGVDAADLYIKLFPEAYAKTVASIDGGIVGEKGGAT